MASAVFAFLTSKFGAYCLIALAVLGFLFVVHHDGATRQEAKDKVKLDAMTASMKAQDAAFQQAKVEQKAAADKQAAEQAAVITDLTGQLIGFETRPPDVVVKWKEKVIHDNAATITAACTTIPNAFVWVRDLTFNPAYADISATATPAMRAADAGISSPDLAKLDGAALDNCRKIERNLDLYNQWYDRESAIDAAYRASVDASNKAIAAKLK